MAPTTPEIGGWFTFETGPFAGRTVRCCVDELQKADIGRRCALLSAVFHVCGMLSRAAAIDSDSRINGRSTPRPWCVSGCSSCGVEEGRSRTRESLSSTGMSSQRFLLPPGRASRRCLDFAGNRSHSGSYATWIYSVPRARIPSRPNSIHQSRHLR